MASKKTDSRKSAYAAICKATNASFNKPIVERKSQNTGVKVFNPATGKIEPMKK